MIPFTEKEKKTIADNLKSLTGGEVIIEFNG